MKINNRKKSRKALYITLSVIAVVAIGVVLYYLVSSNQSATPNPYQPEYPDSVVTPPNNENETKNPNSVDEQTSDEVPPSQVGSITITNLNQKSGYVNALATTSNFTPTQCVYSFSSNGSKPVVREQSGGCTGISIPEGEFDKIGTYTLTVTAYGGGEKLTASADIYVK